jgi:hypothetical protein
MLLLNRNLKTLVMNFKDAGRVFYIFFTVMIVLFSGCSKDDDPPKTNTELITGKKFFLRGWTIDPPISFGGNTISNLYQNVDACEKDNFRIYDQDGSVVFDDGEIKCEAGTPQTETGSWAFANEETILTITYANGLSEDFKIEALTADRLEVSVDFVDDLGSGSKTYTYTFTYRTE